MGEILFAKLKSSGSLICRVAIINMYTFWSEFDSCYGVCFLILIRTVYLLAQNDGQGRGDEKQLKLRWKKKSSIINNRWLEMLYNI